MTKDKKCADLVHQKYQDTLKDYQDAYNYFNEDEDNRKQNENYESYEDFFDYVNQSGLCFDFVEAGTFEGQSVGYWRFQMSITLNIGIWIGLTGPLFVSMMMLYITFARCF